MALKHEGSEATAAAADTKKRRRVAFAGVETGVSANECMKVFLARSTYEVGSTNSIPIDPFDLNHFFGEDGKIYGYKDLKINVWLSAVSFHAYAEISFSKTCDEGKGITDLKPVLQNIFGETLVEKEEFLQSFSKECEYISSVATTGNVINCAACSDEGSIVQVVRTELQGATAFLYSRLVPLVLLLVEGSTPIDITEHGWEMLLVVKKSKHSLDNSSVRLLGFAAVHHFYHYPESTRLRISQILVLPPYRGDGHGRRLLESINCIAVSENIYDVTIEDPSDYLQYIRSSIDCLRLLTLEPIKPALGVGVSSLKESNLSKRTRKLRIVPPADLVELVRQKLKINKKQFLRCWEILVYLNLDPEDRKSMDNFAACIYDCIKGEILGNAPVVNGKRLIQVPSSFGEETSFAVFWSPAGGDADDASAGEQPGDDETQDQQLNELADSQMDEIIQVAKNVAGRSRDELKDMADQ